MSDVPSSHPKAPPDEPAETGPDLEVFEDRSRWVWGAGLAAVVVGLTVFFLAKPGYHLVRTWRTHSLVADGEHALARHDLVGASRNLRAALKLAPKDAQALRLAAHFCSQTANSQGVNYWQQLLATADATVVDRQEYARFAQDLGRLDVSGGIIKNLIASDPENATNQLLVIDQQMLLRDWPLAIRGAELYRQKHPADPYASFLFARAVITAHDAQRMPKARELLISLAKGETAQALPAFRTLGDLQDLTREEVAWVADRLSAAPGSTAADKLQAINLLFRLNPSEVNERLREVGVLLASSPEPIIAAQCVGWLRQHGGQAIVLDSIPAAQAKTNELLTMHRLEALADLRRWDEVAYVVEDPKAPLAPVARFCATAMIASGRGKPLAVAAALNSAIKAAGSSVERLQQIVLLALSLKMPEVAVETAERLLADPKATLWASDFLLRVAKTRDDMTIEREVYQHLASQLGEEMIVVAEKAYIDLLFGDDIPNARAAMARLFAGNPSSLAVRTIFALAELKLDKPAEALALIDGAKTDWKKEEPRWQTVAVAVLEANQQRTAARRLAAMIDVSHLKSPERHLLAASTGLH